MKVKVSVLRALLTVQLTAHPIVETLPFPNIMIGVLFMGLAMHVRAQAVVNKANRTCRRCWAGRVRVPVCGNDNAGAGGDAGPPARVGGAAPGRVTHHAGRGQVPVGELRPCAGQRPGL